MARSLTCLVTLVGLVLAAGCTGDPAPDPVPSPSVAAAPRGPATTLPGATTSLVAGTTAVQLAVGTSRALFGSSPVVLLVAEDDEAGVAEATARATELGVPVLLTPPGATAPDAPTEEEIVRLQADRVVRFGRAATAPTATPAGDGAGNVADVDAALAVTRAAPLDGLLVLAIDGPTSRAAVATARAAGARVLALPDPDPRTRRRRHQGAGRPAGRPHPRHR